MIDFDKQTNKSIVGVLKTSPATVVEDYGKLMRMVNYESFLPKNKKTIVKLNLSWSLYFPACSTEPWQLEGVLKTLREDGYKDIVAMENETVVTNLKKGIKQNKWGKVLRKYNVGFVPLMDEQWIKYEPKVDTPAIKKTFPAGHRIPECFIGTNILHLPTIKTHGHTTMTGAIKNAFGGLITERRHHAHKYIHEVLIDLLKIQKEIHTGIFAVMDGTVCGNGHGPRTMKPAIKNLLLASNDQVAIDSVSSKIMGFNPMGIKKIKLADDLNLGNGKTENIEVVGENIEKENWGFNVGESPIIWGDKLFRKGKLSFIEPLIFHTPLFNLAILCSALYHDYFWYPLKGKREINKFMETAWGKLFRTYN